MPKFVGIFGGSTAIELKYNAKRTTVSVSIKTFLKHGFKEVLTHTLKTSHGISVSFRLRLEGKGFFTDTEGQVWTGQFRYKAAPGLQFQLRLD